MIVNVQFKVIWQFKNATHFKVTKCKKIINKEPKWHTNIKVGDKLESWYCCNWDGGDGNWRKHCVLKRRTQSLAGD